MSYTWVSEGLDLTQMVMDIQKQLKTTIIIIPNNLCFNNITKKIITCDTQGSMPYSLVSEALDLAQMVLDILHLYFSNHWSKSFHLTSQP